MKSVEIGFKVNRKGIVREIFESYRELPLYKYALLDIYCAIEGVFPNERKCRYIDDSNDAFIVEKILEKIRALRTSFGETESNTKNGGNTSD